MTSEQAESGAWCQAGAMETQTEPISEDSRSRVFPGISSVFVALIDVRIVKY